MTSTYHVKKVKTSYLCGVRCEKCCKKSIRYILIPKIFINSKSDYKFCEKCLNDFINEFELISKDSYSY
jgi:hypothetical protein